MQSAHPDPDGATSGLISAELFTSLILPSSMPLTIHSF
jgi:hypothetical protein